MCSGDYNSRGVKQHVYAESCSPVFLGECKYIILLLREFSLQLCDMAGCRDFPRLSTDRYETVVGRPVEVYRSMYPFLQE
jgi:hypothetical protein